MRRRRALPPDVLAHVPGSHERILWGMRPAVWVLLLWELLSVLLVLIVYVSGSTSSAALWWRLVGVANCVGMSVAILVLRGRTPTWLIYLAVALTAAIGIVNVAIAESVSVALNGLLIAMVLAAYVAYFLPRRPALTLVLLNCAGILVALAISGDDLGFRFFFPWFTVTALSVAQVLIVGTLVRDLKSSAVTDPLTGLVNRGGIELLVTADPRRTRLRQPRALLVIDLDDFKAVNDRYGHAVGDRLLVDFAETLVAVTRSGDVVARLGGDEFVVVLPSTDTQAALALAGRLRETIGGNCSFGATIWSDDEPVTEAIQRADAEMYRDKARPRDERLGRS